VRHIGDDFAGVFLADDGAFRDLEDDISAVSAVTSALTALLTVPCFEIILVFIGKKGVHSLVDFEYNISAAASVASVRSAGRNIFLTSETDVTVAALAGFYVDPCAICEHMVLLD
jgi:hypothetical protein